MHRRRALAAPALVALALAAALALASRMPSRARAQGAELRPPAVAHLAPIEVPPDVARELGGAIEVTVLIDATGRAALDAEPDVLIAARDAIALAVSRSSFTPATRGGAAIVSRTRVRLEVRALAAPARARADDAPPRPDTPLPAPEPPTPRPPPAATRDVPTFAAIARASPETASAITVDAAEARDMPGLQGDPYRAIETMPGVVPLLSGLPFSYVRGAPPAGTIYLWDDVPVPSLFHVAAGPSTIHAARIGEVHLWPGVAPARYGRYVGGVVLGDAARGEARLGGEIELRLLDVNGMITVPIERRGVVRASGRYGYPGPIVGAAVPGLELDYWDYQLTADVTDDEGGRTRVIAIGAYDRLRQDLESIDTLGEQSSIVLHFHRIEVRHQRPIAPGAELGVALRLGYDHSRLGEAVGVELWSASPRVWSTFRLGFARLRVGADMVASGGVIESSTRDDDGAISGALLEGAAYAGARTRTAIGAHVEALLPIPGVLRLELGLRVDAWITAREVQAAPSPRARLVVHVAEGVDVHAAIGLAQQPAVLFLPLPGFADLAVDRGLQTALQSDWGASVRLPLGFSIEAQGFFHYFDQVLLPDLYVQDRRVCVERWCTQLALDPRARARVVGLEAFVRRDPREDVAGSLSYTLSEASARAHEGFEFVPGFDVRHVLQALLRVRLFGSLEISARAFVRSGRVVGRFFVNAGALEVQRYEQRLPWFFRADAEIAYAWDAGWGRLRASIGWTNLTIAAEPIGLDCELSSSGRPEAPCPVQYAPPIFLPSLGIRAEL